MYPDHITDQLKKIHLTCVAHLHRGAGQIKWKMQMSAFKTFPIIYITIGSQSIFFLMLTKFVHAQEKLSLIFHPSQSIGGWWLVSPVFS